MDWETVQRALLMVGTTMALGAVASLLLYGSWRYYGTKAARFASLKRRQERQLAEVRQFITLMSRELQKSQESVEHAAKQRLILLDATQEVSAFLLGGADRTAQQRRLLLEDLLLATAQGIVMFPAPVRARLMLYDPQANLLVQHAAFVPEGLPAFQGASFAPGEGYVGQAFRNREVVVEDDYRPRHKTEAERRQHPYHSLLCVPVPANGAQPVGVLNMDSGEVAYFRQANLEFVQLMANLMGILFSYPVGESVVRRASGEL